MTNTEAIEILTNVKNTPQITWTNGADVAFDRAIEALKNERPQGEWIKGQEISRTMIGGNVECIEYKDYTCSNCGLVLDYLIYLLYNCNGSSFYKFCPNCGADMRGDKK